MSIDINRIYTLLVQRPQIRTVEIADIIDCDPEQVEPRLAADISAGRVVVHRVTAPNGRSANGFEFSPEFMKSKEYRLLAGLDAPVVPVRPIATAAVSATVPPVAAAAEASFTNPGAVANPAAPKIRARRADPLMSYADRAIALIRAAGGRANNEELRKNLGLGPGAAPSSYLRAAVLSERLARDGRDWVLGVRADAPARYSPGKTAPRAIPVPAAAPAAAAFRCARWSDGVLELQRGGETIATLVPAEQDAVVALLVGTV